MSKIKLGSKVKDRLTGFAGIVSAHAEYLTGCDQYHIQPEVKDGDFKDGKWFDEGRLEVLQVDAFDIKDAQQANKPGCDIAAPSK